MDPPQELFKDTGMLDDPADDDYAPPGGSRSSASPKSRARKSNKGSPTTPNKGKGRERRKSEEKVVQPKRDVPFPLFDLPGEIIDAILYSPSLRVHDHLRLAATCRALRSAYYTPPPSGKGFASFSSPIWKALTNERNFESLGKNRYYPGACFYGGGQSKEESGRILKHLWSREDRIDPDKMLVLAQKTVTGRKGRGGVVTPATVVVQAVRSVEWDDVIATLSTQRITKTTAKSEYKLNDSELSRLRYREKRNPHYRSAAPMQLYLEIAVETLAFRLHGGYAGHIALLKKRETAAAKAAQTKRAKLDGTWVSPKKKSRIEQEEEDEDEGDEHIFMPPPPPAFGAFPAAPAFGGAVAAGMPSLSYLSAQAAMGGYPPSSSSTLPSHLAGFVGLQPASTSTLPALPAFQQPHQPYHPFSTPAAPAGPAVAVKPDLAPSPFAPEAGPSTITSTPPDAKVELKKEEEEPDAPLASTSAAEVDVKPEIKSEETDEAEEGGRRTSRRRGAKRSYKQYADGGFDVFE